DADADAVASPEVTAVAPDADRRRTDQRLEACGFGNVLLPADLLDVHGLTLAPRYRHSGGEDTDFCVRARAHGSDVRFAADAICYEETGAERLGASFRRKLVLTQHAVYSDVVRRHRPRAILRRAVTSLVRLLAALTRLPLTAVAGHPEPALLQLCAGVGGLLGLCGVLPSRY
ncbi:MAG: succinoglycan biosynthesis protein ExoM, partial [Frankiaceae bacterium]|nr:succinoglycan biosynthesis protein ExoM [Frankiaceae bacterium]